MYQNLGEYKIYVECRKDAQRAADETGKDFGLEKNSLFNYFRFFGLPNPENRRGHELRCEVVRPERWPDE